MGPVGKKGSNDIEGRVGKTEVVRESGEKNRVVDSVKGSREVKKDKSRDLLMMGSEKEVIVYREKGSLSGVVLPKGRLGAGDSRE